VTGAFLLPDDLRDYVAGQIAVGAYPDERAMIVAALRRLRDGPGVQPPAGALTADHMRFAYEAAGLGIWDVDSRTGRRLWSREFRSICGLGETVEPDATLFSDMIHPGDRERVNEAYRHAVRGDTGGAYRAEFRILRRDTGEERDVIAVGRYMWDEHGEPLRGIGCLMDVTDRRKAERALAESEARLELACEAAELGIWDWDLVDGTFVYSDRAREICGIPPGVPITLETIRQGVHPEDLPRTSAASRRALDPEIREKIPYEYRVVHTDGSVRWVVAHGEAVFGLQNGRPAALRYVGTIQDVTEQKRAEERDRDNAARLRLAIEAGRMAVWEWRADTGRITGSPELYRLLGHPEGSVPSLDEIRAGYLPGEQERVQAAGQAALAAGDDFFQVEFGYRGPDGNVRWMMLRAEIRLDAARRPAAVVGVLLDVSDQKKAVEQKQLLIHELNHRVKNTLASVVSIAGQTLRNAPDLDAARADLETRLVALARAHDVLTSENWSGAGLREIVDQAIAPFRQPAGRFAVSGPPVRLQPRAALVFAMALHELATNAAKYGALSADGGAVTIAWSLTETPRGPGLHLVWSETGGPPVSRPRRRGFGSRLIERSLAYELDGRVSLEFRPGGAVCTIEAPLTP
jgi:PAS domain S-box-containing protein